MHIIRGIFFLFFFISLKGKEMFIIILYLREKTRGKFKKKLIFFGIFSDNYEDILPKAVCQKIIRINLLMLFFYYCYLSKNYLNLLRFIKIREANRDKYMFTLQKLFHSI